MSALFPAADRLWEPRGIVVADRTNLIHVNGDKRTFAPEVKLLYLIVAGMLFISCILMIRQLIKYMQFRKVYRETSSEPLSQVWEEQFFQIKEQLGIKRKVKFVCSGFCQSPMAFGAISPVVVFPKSGLDDPRQREYMMKHELTHIKNGDLFFRFLALIATAIHWFNPVVYFLYFELTAVSEMVCDRSVLECSDDGMRRSYSNLVLDYAADRDYGCFPAIGFADKWNMKRRILEMKKETDQDKSLSRKIETYIQENFQDPDLNISITSQHFGITPAYLSSIYKKQTGKSLLDYINTLRIDHARELLEQGLSVVEVAPMAGFRDSGSFIRAFKKKNGVTPGQFKKKL